MINFKFLSKNENTIFDESIITRARVYVSYFLDCIKTHGFANRQLTYRSGTFYIVEFEYDSDIDSYYTTVLYCLRNYKATFRYRDDLLMSVNVSSD